MEVFGQAFAGTEKLRYLCRQNPKPNLYAQNCNCATHQFAYCDKDMFDEFYPKTVEYIAAIKEITEN